MVQDFRSSSYNKAAKERFAESPTKEKSVTLKDVVSSDVKGVNQVAIGGSRGGKNIVFYPKYTPDARGRVESEAVEVPSQSAATNGFYGSQKIPVSVALYNKYNVETRGMVVRQAAQEDNPYFLLNRSGEAQAYLTERANPAELALTGRAVQFRSKEEQANIDSNKDFVQYKSILDDKSISFYASKTKNPKETVDNPRPYNKDFVQYKSILDDKSISFYASKTKNPKETVDNPRPYSFKLYVPGGTLEASNPSGVASRFESFNLQKNENLYREKVKAQAGQSAFGGFGYVAGSFFTGAVIDPASLGLRFVTKPIETTKNFVGSLWRDIKDPISAAGRQSIAFGENPSRFVGQIYGFKKVSDARFVEQIYGFKKVSDAGFVGQIYGFKKVSDAGSTITKPYTDIVIIRLKSKAIDVFNRWLTTYTEKENLNFGGGSYQGLSVEQGMSNFNYGSKVNQVLKDFEGKNVAFTHATDKLSPKMFKNGELVLKSNVKLDSEGKPIPSNLGGINKHRTEMLEGNFYLAPEIKSPVIRGEMNLPTANLGIVNIKNVVEPGKPQVYTGYLFGDGYSKTEFSFFKPRLQIFYGVGVVGKSNVLRSELSTSKFLNQYSEGGRLYVSPENIFGKSREFQLVAVAERSKLSLKEYKPDYNVVFGRKSRINYKLPVVSGTNLNTALVKSPSQIIIGGTKKSYVPNSFVLLDETLSNPFSGKNFASKFFKDLYPKTRKRKVYTAEVTIEPVDTILTYKNTKSGKLSYFSSGEGNLLKGKNPNLLSPITKETSSLSIDLLNGSSKSRYVTSGTVLKKVSPSLFFSSSKKSIVRSSSPRSGSSSIFSSSSKSGSSPVSSSSPRSGSSPIFSSSSKSGSSPVSSSSPRSGSSPVSSSSPRSGSSSVSSSSSKSSSSSVSSSSSKSSSSSRFSLSLKGSSSIISSSLRSSPSNMKKQKKFKKVSKIKYKYKKEKVGMFVLPSLRNVNITAAGNPSHSVHIPLLSVSVRSKAILSQSGFDVNIPTFEQQRRRR